MGAKQTIKKYFRLHKKMEPVKDEEDYIFKHTGQIHGKKQNGYERMKKKNKRLINTFTS